MQNMVEWEEDVDASERKSGKRYAEKTNIEVLLSTASKEIADALTSSEANGMPYTTVRRNLACRRISAFKENGEAASRGK